MNIAELPFGAATYAVLLTSWLAICSVFELIERLGCCASYRLQPSRASSRPASLKRSALRLAALNWLWVGVAVLLTAPALERLLGMKSRTLPIALLQVRFFSFYYMTENFTILM